MFRTLWLTQKDLWPRFYQDPLSSPNSLYSAARLSLICPPKGGSGGESYTQGFALCVYFYFREPKTTWREMPGGQPSQVCTLGLFWWGGWVSSLNLILRAKPNPRRCVSPPELLVVFFLRLLCEDQGPPHQILPWAIPLLCKCRRHSSVPKACVVQFWDQVESLPVMARG